MRISILGAESMGVRSLATRVETGERVYLIDPAVSISPRRKAHPPHPVELAASAATRRAIEAAAGRADALILSHYHHDHFTPFEERASEWSDAERAAALYRGKRIFAKHPGEHINGSQRRRAATLWEREDLDLHIAEGARWHELEISAAVPHGPRGSRQGFVVMSALREGSECFVHASDIQLLDPQAVSALLAFEPTVVLVAGPALYHPELREEERRTGLRQLQRLVKAVPTAIVDHHLLRSEAYREEARDAFRAARRAGHRLLTAAEWMGRPPLPLEACRERLHAAMPHPRDWFERFEAGEEDARAMALELVPAWERGELDRRILGYLG